MVSAKGEARDLLDTDQAAERTGLSKKAIQALARDGVFIDATKGNRGEWQIPEAAVADYLARNPPLGGTQSRAARFRLFIQKWQAVALSNYLATLASGLGGLVTVVLAAIALANWLDGFDESAAVSTTLAADSTTLTTTPPTIPPTETTELLEVPAEGPGEVLVLIANFTPGGSDDISTVSDEIDHVLEVEATDAEIQGLRFEAVSTAIDDQDLVAARSLGERYGASVIIWGRETDFRLTANLLRLDAPGLIESVDQPRGDFAQPSEYLRFVTSDLAPLLFVVSLYTIAETQVVASNFDIASEYVEAVIENIDAVPGEIQSEIYYNAGFLHGELGQYSEAIDDYTRAISLEPDDPLAFVNRGIIHDYAGDLEAAISDYETAIEIDPRNYYAFNNRGIAYRGLGELERSIEDYDRAVMLGLNPVVGLTNRGNVYSDLGETDSAIRDYDQAIDLDPTYVDAVINRGVAHRESGDPRRAIEDYNRAIVLTPDEAAPYGHRGNAYMDLAEFENAIASYDEAIARQPDDTFGYFARGAAYAALGEVERAIEDFDQSIALDQDHLVVYVARGQEYAYLGDFEQAVADFDYVIEAVDSGRLPFPGTGYDSFLAFREELASNLE